MRRPTRATPRLELTLQLLPKLLMVQMRKMGERVLPLPPQQLPIV